MMDTIASSEFPDYYSHHILLRGDFRGKITIPINIEQEERRQRNWIFNRGVPEVRTDYSSSKPAP